jgi:hypothetical protein
LQARKKDLAKWGTAYKEQAQLSYDPPALLKISRSSRASFQSGLVILYSVRRFPSFRRGLYGLQQRLRHVSGAVMSLAAWP